MKIVCTELRQACMGMVSVDYTWLYNNSFRPWLTLLQKSADVQPYMTKSNQRDETIKVEAAAPRSAWLAPFDRKHLHILTDTKTAV